MTTLAQAFLSTQKRSAEMITATVVDIDAAATTLTILIRGTSTNAAFLSNITPKLGDLVAVLRQDSTLLVLGTPAGVGGNQVANFSFEQTGIDGGVPPQWTQQDLGGAAAVEAMETGYAPAGLYELGVSSGAAPADCIVYSAPIPVTPGDTWAVSALATAVYADGAPLDATAELHALYFANETDLYPDLLADTTVAMVPQLGAAPTHTSLSGTVTVPSTPAGVAMMRIGVRSDMASGSTTMQWDVVIARETA